MGTREIKPLPPRSRLVGRACLLEKWSGIWMPRCSWMNTHIGRQRGYTAPDFPRNVSPSHSLRKKRGKTNDLLRWLAWPPTFRPTDGYLPSDRWGPRPAEQRSGTSITKCINWGDYWDLCHAGQSRQVNWQGTWCPLWKIVRGRKRMSSVVSKLKALVQGHTKIPGGECHRHEIQVKEKMMWFRFSGSNWGFQKWCWQMCRWIMAFPLHMHSGFPTEKLEQTIVMS